MADNKGQVDVVISQLAIDNIAKANAALDKTLANILAINKASRSGSGGTSPNDAEKINASNKASTERLKLADQTLILNKKLLQSQIALGNAEGKTTAEIAKNKVELQQRNAKIRETAKLSSSLTTEYQKQTIKLNNLRKKYKDLALTEGEATKKARALRVEITKLDTRLKKVDGNVGQFQRNVGNYGKAMSGAVGAARRLAGAMGLVGGAFLIVKVIRDVTKRIKEFDKVMQNLSGILGVNRKDLKSLEQTIINVAGASIKTSNEVAELAQTLVTLGKSKEEVEDLLKPVNDLSIGLEATSQEAGELLIQTLNAFGESSKEAQRYADIIAKMRTSTALDFERIKDALGFLAPVSKAAGVSFENTGAILGVLVDNGIKAARAGRLMSTTFLKLASEGKTLEQALDLVNKAQAEGATQTEILALSSKTFGKQSAALGLILANNRDRVAELTGEFENAQGTLDELTEKQLESLDAKLKILDSTWEKFILNIERGDGAIAGFFKSFIEGLTNAIDAIDLISVSSEGGLEFINNMFKAMRVGGLAAMQSEKSLKEAIEERKRVTSELADLQQKDLEQKGLVISKEKLIGEMALLTNKEIQNRIDIFKESQKIELDGVEATEEVAKKTIEFYQKIISETKKLRDSTATTAAEYASFNKTIKDAEDGIKKLTGAYGKFIDVQIKFAPESIGWIEQMISANKVLISQSDDAKLRQKLTEENVLLAKQLKILKDIDDTAVRGARVAGGDLSAFVDIESEDDLEDDSALTTGFTGQRGSNLPFRIGGGSDTGFETDAEGEARLALEADIVAAAGETASAIIDLGNALFDRKIAQIDAEIAANEEKYAILQELAEGDAEQQRLLAIEQEEARLKLEKKKRKEQKKQAIFNKAAAVVEIGIKTAIGIVNALASSGPPPLGIALAAIIGTLGAIQTATVLATPIPQFAKGGVMDKDGLAVVGDGGRKEVVKNPDGSIQVTPSTSTVVGLQKGAEIFPSIDAFNKDFDISDQIYSASLMASVTLNNAQIKGYLESQRVMDDKLLNAMLDNTKAIKKQKLSVRNNNQSIDIPYQMYKNNYAN